MKLTILSAEPICQSRTEAARRNIAGEKVAGPQLIARSAGSDDLNSMFPEFRKHNSEDEWKRIGVGSAQKTA
jgi:hypothetical protein